MKMYTQWLGSAALAALLTAGIAGCGSDSGSSGSVSGTITPYERIAVIPGSWDDVLAIADQIGTYVDTTDENATLGYPTNWIVAGANHTLGEDYNTTDLLPIPVGANKSRVVELCNSAYATKAMSTGRVHGPALPCEVSVHSDGTNVYVDMLNADAIFSIFFTDINDTDGTMEGIASDVKSEIRGMVMAALADKNPTESWQALGPVFDAKAMDDVSYTTPYIVYKYQNGGVFTSTDAKNLAKDIIAKLGTDTATADTNVPGLSSGSAWRSGRPEPLAIPGVQVVEACSPKYAKKATALGTEYITALPCEIVVYVDETDPTGETLAISFLNPNFMFGTMFGGAVEKAYAAGTITKDDVIEYSTLAEVVFGDLRLIVDAAVQESALGLQVK